MMFMYEGIAAPPGSVSDCRLLKESRDDEGAALFVARSELERGRRLCMRAQYKATNAPLAFFWSSAGDQTWHALETIGQRSAIPCPCPRNRGTGARRGPQAIVDKLLESTKS
jgi:hypothetical protein